jgi:hypothetical protein
MTHISQDGKTRFDGHVGAKRPLSNRPMIQFVRRCWYRCSGLALRGDRGRRGRYRDQEGDYREKGDEDTHRVW